MNAFHEVLDTLSSTFKGDTNTGLDVLESAPLAPLVAEALVEEAAEADPRAAA